MNHLTDPPVGAPRPVVRQATVSPVTSAAALKASVNWSWVPIRSLAPRHRERITAHLLQLGERDRYLRFGYCATDAQVSKYVDMLDFDRDELFGIFSRRLELIAMAHLAHAERRPLHDTHMSEFGVSVLPSARGRGFGRRLFEHATLHARNRGVGTLFIHALSENTAMLKIARQAGARVERDGSESEARLTLPPDTLASHVDELVETQAAEIDYRLKVRARQVSGFLDVFTDVRNAVGKTSRSAEE